MLSSARGVASDLVPKLALLHATARHPHLSAATEAVGAPQPMATWWLAALDRTVGVPLTRRVGR